MLLVKEIAKLWDDLGVSVRLEHLSSLDLHMHAWGSRTVLGLHMQIPKHSNTIQNERGIATSLKGNEPTRTFLRAL